MERRSNEGEMVFCTQQISTRIHSYVHVFNQDLNVPYIRDNVAVLGEKASDPGAVASHLYTDGRRLIDLLRYAPSSGFGEFCSFKKNKLTRKIKVCE